VVYTAPANTTGSTRNVFVPIAGKSTYFGQTAQ
jgi:hypothetical protein